VDWIRKLSGLESRSVEPAMKTMLAVLPAVPFTYLLSKRIQVRIWVGGRQFYDVLRGVQQSRQANRDIVP
jgi:hypothetical protein